MPLSWAAVGGVSWKTVTVGSRARAIRCSATALGRAGGVDGQCLLEPGAQPGGGQVDVGPALHDVEADDLEAARAERRLARRTEEDRRGQRVHVGRLGDLGVPDDLGGEVAGGADEHAGLGQPGGVDQVRDAEVDDQRVTVDDHHIGRLEVTVDDVGGVDRHQRGAHALGQPDHLVGGERAVLQDGLLQRAPRGEPGHDVGLLGRQLGVEHLRDVRAAHAAAWSPPRG